MKSILGRLAPTLLLTASLLSATEPLPMMNLPVSVGGLAAKDPALQKAIQEVQNTEEYQIGPSDLLKIMVYQEPEMELELRVSQVGTISFPLVGTIKLGGLSVARAVETLQKALSEYLVNPQATILIKEYKDRKIFVLGEVKTSGAYELPLDTPLTVIEAISMAGGFTELAAPDKTRVIRKKDGKLETIIADISKITKSRDKRDPLTLIANDIVFVPQTFF